MLTHETLQQLQRYNFHLLARQEPNGQRRMRCVALAHLKDGKNFTEVASALRVTRHAVMRWLKRFAIGGMDHLAGIPHYWGTQRLPKSQEEAFRKARRTAAGQPWWWQSARGRYSAAARRAVCGNV
jgi:transposase